MNRLRTGLSATALQIGALVLTLVVAFGAMLCGGCHAKPDPNREFAMTMDGEEYLSHLGAPFGTLEEIEAGFSNQVRCRIVFPLTAPGTHHRPGVDVEIDPQRITLGQEIVFG